MYHVPVCCEFKFIDAQQANLAYQYKNIKRKLYKTNAAIWYNKICRQKRLKPKYINIRINGKNQQCQRTYKAAINFRINQEIKYLYIKKQKLNERLYKHALQCSNDWRNLWDLIQHTIEEQLGQEMGHHYDNLNKKLDTLQAQQHHQNNKPRTNQGRQFYTRTSNLTNIRFTAEEMSILDMGLQYSIEKPLNVIWNDMIIETEIAIRKLDTRLQNTYRILAAKKLSQINNTMTPHNIQAKRHNHVLRNIQTKLTQNNAIITKADKGRTTVIIYITDYDTKVHNFITKNNYNTLPKDPTNKYQQLITTTLKQCSSIIDKPHARYVTQRQPQPPTLKAQIKLHKPDQPIRPVVNNIGAPAYKLAKHLSKTLKDYIHLDYQFNTKNSTTLAQELDQLSIQTTHRLMTLDISDMYVNIPIHDSIRIAKTLLTRQNNALITGQMIQLLETILQQNYFKFENTFYQPTQGLSMGSPLSGTIAEIFLQHFEQSHLKHLLENKAIIYYTRYVDDILIIYNTEHTSPEHICEQANRIHPNLKFTPTHEEDNTISFLDLQLTRQHKKLDINIYRKPTTTDTTINYLSNHPTEHKLAAYRYMIHRMLTLPLTQSNRETEWRTILRIAHNNNFPIHHIKRLRRHLQRQPDRKTREQGQIWTTFTFHNPIIRRITNLFRNTNIRIAYRSTNTITQRLGQHRRHDNDNTTPNHDYNKSGIYQLKCNTCHKAYIGQTSRNITQRYKEHIRYIKNNEPKSAYAEHILQNRHEYGHLTDTMTLLRAVNRTHKLLPYEQLYIQKYHHKDILIPEQQFFDNNPLLHLAKDTKGYDSPTTTDQ